MKINHPGKHTLTVVTTLLIALFAPTDTSANFRFSVAADQRLFAGPGLYDTDEYFRGACRALNRVGPGVFLISPGDIDPVVDSQWTVATWLGQGFQWIPVTGNHELPGLGFEDYLGANMDALRGYDYDPNGSGIPPDIVNTGPPGCPETTFSFAYENAHFVVLNQYCDEDGDTETMGDIPDHLYDWLVADLAATDREHIFVFGHEPAFPQPDVDRRRLRHLDDSLNEHPANRDRFWALLAAEGVTAYFCGHTHNYSEYFEDGVWQIDVAHARGLGDDGAASTFVVVDVDGSTVTFDAYRDEHDGMYDYLDSVRHGVLSPAPFIDTLIPAGALWRYLDDGSDQGAAWLEPEFDDNLWPEGPAELGYGDGDEATTLDFGTDPDNKYITSYFRHTLAIDDPYAWDVIWLRLLRDDGAVVHINGERFLKSSMPVGDILYDTLATIRAVDAEETAFIQYEVDPALFEPGDNIIAVEVHQAVVDSSDISFDFQLLGMRRPAVIVSPELTCVPAGGTLPFQSRIEVTLGNDYGGTPRRIAARLDVALANGGMIPSWRAGFTNVPAGGSFSTAWNQYLPALGSLTGVNSFTLVAADVTPAPWNQPPYPPAGETASASCTITGIVP